MKSPTRPGTNGTFVDWLTFQSQVNPNKLAFQFLDHGEQPGESLTYAELHQRAVRLALHIGDQADSGSRALLLFQPDLRFVVAFFACLYARIIAVPAYPPRNNQNLNRLLAIINDAEADLILTTSELTPQIRQRFNGLPQTDKLIWLTTEQGNYQTEWQTPNIDPNQTAFLQYTSGSTGNPKGVMVSHANLITNCHDLGGGAHHAEKGVMVTWLPIFHDMGLIYGVLLPVFKGWPCYMMAPAAFLQKPLRWLEAISRYGGTHSAAPNFAFALCAQRASSTDINHLNLRSWQVALNGSEPVQESTLCQFQEAFTPVGLSPTTLCPGYGLAEATLKATSGRPGESFNTIRVDLKTLSCNEIHLTNQANASTLVSCGRSEIDTHILIVNPETQAPSEANQIGEIWLCGKTIASGYWNRNGETTQTFLAHTSCGKGPFLRSGDLGFIHQGELYITGRIKELLIIRGRNHYPQDIEVTVSSAHPMLKAHAAAAFTISQDGEDHLVIVQEIDRNHWRNFKAQEIISAVRRAVAAEHGLHVHQLMLIRPSSLPKTSSGKIMRLATRDGFLKRNLKVLYSSQQAQPDSSPAEGNTEKYLQDLYTEVTGQSPEPSQNLMTLGIDSMQAVTLQHRFESDLECLLPMAVFLDDHTLEDLLHLIKNADLAKKQSVENQSCFPLSHNQKALWRIHEYQPESAAYHLPLISEINHTPDLTLFNKVWNGLKQRHPALRTIFEKNNNDLKQRILTAPNLPLQIIDHSDPLPEYLAHKEIARPFALNHNLPWRLLLIRTPTKAVMVLTIHHIVADFWSFGLLLDEFARDYSLLRQGKAIPISANVSVADFISHQQEQLKHSQSLHFWTSVLNEPPPTLNLPLEQNRPRSPAYPGELHYFTIASETSRALERLTQKNNLTLYTLLLSSWQLLLHRATNQDDLIVGSPSDGRDRASWRHLVSYLVNPICHRSKLTPKLSFADFLRQNRKRILTAFQHRHYPFDLIVQKLAPERNPGVHPFFQAMFAMQSSHRLSQLDPLVLRTQSAPLDLGDLHFTALPVPHKTAQFELTLTMVAGSQLKAEIEYRSDLYSSHLIANLAQSFEVLLQHISQYPQTPVHAVPLLSQKQAKDLHSWSFSTDLPPTKDLLISLRDLAKAGPETSALVLDNQIFTRAQFLQRARELAGFLKSKGLCLGEIVAIHSKNPVDFIIGFTGTLLIGAVALPLDPEIPQSRREHILKDSGARCIIHGNESGQPIAIQEHYHQLPAYLLYTSGSSGYPKGVAVSRQAFNTHIQAVIQTYRLEAEDRVLHFASPAFDVALEEIFPTLVSGGSVHIVNQIRRFSFADFAARISEHKVTILNLPASFWHDWTQFLHQQMEPPPKGLRLLVTGNEPVRSERLNQWRKLPRSIPVINAYGPTETTITASAMINPTQASNNSVPIGFALPSTRLYLFDKHTRPTPPGLEGEIYIGGIRLAQGYWKNPRQTALAFIPDPNTKGGRLYKTGDLASHLPNGSLLFQKRRDTQIKLRGNRIEPGEIVSQIMRQPGVTHAAITLSKGENPVLVSWYQGKAKPHTLRDAIQQSLPSAMVPTHIIPMERMPLTPGGKPNLQKLRAMALPESTLNHEPPVNPAEELLVELWSELFPKASIHRHSDFFQLGGHSLLATRLISRVQAQYGQSPPLRLIFENPVLHQLAFFIQPDIQPQKTSKSTSYPSLSPAQQGLWFLTRLDPDLAAYNMPLVLDLEGDLDIPNLIRAANQLATRHQSLRATFSANGEQIIHPSLPPHFLVMDISAKPQIVKTISAQEATTPFNLIQGPPWRLRLLRTAPQKSRLIITVHHLVSDGWSMNILVNELAFLYNGATLPKLPTNYISYVQGQHQWLENEKQSLEAYWRQQLQHHQRLDLPEDNPSPKQDAPSVVLLEQETANLKELVRQNEVTLYITGLSIFALLLSRQSGQTDILIGAPTHGRNHPDLESLIGFFNNTLVLRCRPNPILTYADYLQQTRDMTLDAFTNDGLPLHLLVRELSSEQREPLFRVFFNLLNLPQNKPNWKDLQVTPADIPPPPAKFDLTLYFQEDGDQLQFHLHHNEKKICHQRAKNLLDQYIHLLNQIVQNPNKPLSSYTTCGSSRLPDPSKILQKLSNRSCLDLGHSTSDKPALIANHTLSHSQLWRKISQTSAHLHQIGLSDAIIALPGQRNTQFVIHLLAILKARAVAAIIPPDLPAPNRLQQIKVIKPKAWLGPQDQVIPERCIRVGAIKDAKAANLEVTVQTPATLLMTSGTSGKPNPVVASHGPLSHFIKFYLKTFKVTSDHRFAFLSGPGHDPALRDILIPLSAGASLYIPTFSIRKNPEKLAIWLQQNCITHIHITPSLARLLTAQPLPHLPHLQYLFFGGEPLSASVCQPFFKAAPNIKIFNVYGATETPQFAAYRQIQPNQTGPIPIGRAIPGSQLLILNQNRLADIGELGQIAIRGSALALGYHHRPGEQARKFVPNPFKPNDPVFLTGDLGRYLPNGEAQFYGRVDRQLKLRGMRIEPAAIEAVIRSVATSAHVQIHQEQLTAWVTPNDLDIDALRDQLIQNLPNWMIPAHIIPVSQMPLTPNGKIDIGRLPKYQASKKLQNESPQLNRLTRYISEILNNPAISADDNFFQHGGHSLLAVELVNRLSQDLHRDLPPSLLFKYPTARALIKQIDKIKPEVNPTGDPNRAPLTPAQSQLLLLHQLHPGSAYNMPAMLKVERSLVIPGLIKIWDELVQYHPNLRTRIHIKTQPVQIVDPTIALPFQIIDSLTTLPLIEQIINKPFDLTPGPLFRIALIRKGSDQNLLVFVAHHIIMDGGSLELLLKHFNLLLRGRSLPTQSLPFTQLAHTLMSTDANQHTQWWAQHLRDMPQMLSLPLDYPRPPNWKEASQSQPIHFPASPIRQLAQQTQTTPFIILQTLLAITLSRYAQTDEVPIGFPHAHRPLGFEETAGLFAKTLVLRNRIDLQQSMTDAFQNTSNLVQDALMHHQAPFQDILDALNTTRHPSASPLFQIMFALQTTGQEPETTQLEVLQPPDPGAKFDLTLALTEMDDDFTGRWIFPTALFHPNTIHNIHKALLHLINQTIQNHTRPIGAYRLTNQTTHLESSPVPVAIHTIDSQKPAYIHSPQQRSFSYEQLDQYTNAFIHRFRSFDFPPETPIAVLLPPGPKRLISMLAVLKSGYTLLPLDTAYPENRIRFMMKDSGARLLITEQEQSWDIPTLAPKLEESQVTSNISIHQEQTAYIIYTSGSTGKPKGVAVSHKALQAHTKAVRHVYQITSEDRILQFRPFAFDPVFEEILPSLEAGATLVGHLEQGFTPVSFQSYIIEHAITLINLPAVWWHEWTAWLKETKTPPPNCLRMVICGGESVDLALHKYWSEHIHIPFINAYGPTEATVTATYWRSEGARSVPIGKPMPDTHLQILDKQHQPLPPGAPGELLIGGSRLARGYFNNPRQTALAFVPGDHGRLYKTGDIVRLDPENQIEYLHRRDQQIKLRGYRIEPGEIQNALTKINGLTRAYVHLHQRQLIAFVILQKPLPDLKQKLRQQLPDFMIPNRLIEVSTIPQTENGKVDLGALLKAIPQEKKSKPATPMQSQLLEVWSQVLNKPDIGVQQNFFELGGDSILAIRLVSKLQRRGLQIDPRDIFQHQTIEKLAPHVQQQSRSHQNPSGPVPLGPIQTRFFAKNLSYPNHFNQALLLRSQPIHPSNLQNAIQELADHHPLLRAHFTNKQQIVQTQLRPHLHVFHLQKLNQIKAIATDLQSSLDIQQGPLWTAALFITSQNQYRLLLIAHHLIIDGVSWRILIDGLANLLQGKTLNPVLTSYAQWSRQQKITLLEDPQPHPENSFGAARTHITTLSSTLTKALLNQAHRLYQTRPDELILAALSLSFGHDLTIDMEHHGRNHETLNLSGTIGWFTVLYSVDIPHHRDPDLLIPNSKDAVRLSSQKPAPHNTILFNFLGSNNDLVIKPFTGVDPGDIGPIHHPKNLRSHLIEINAYVEEETLSIHWRFNPEIGPGKIVPDLAQSHIHHLENLIQHCLKSKTREFTRADFPLVNMPLKKIQTIAEPKRHQRLYPLSPLQQGLLFHAINDPKDPAYFQQIHTPIASHVHLPSFRRAWDTLLQQHDVLRSAFLWHDLKQPVQLVYRSCKLPWTIIDLRHLEPAQQDKRFNELLEHDRKKPFHLANPPLLRFTIVLGKQTRLIWSHHHLLLDGWSVPILIQQVAKTYQAINEGKDLHIPQSPPYESFIKWISQRPDGLEWHRDSLKGFTIPTPIPGAFTNQTGPASELRVPLDSALSHQLKQLAATRRITLFTLLQAAWALLLRAYSHQNDVVFGVTFSGRPPDLAGSDSMIGLFINSLPVRVQIPNSKVFPWLQTLQDQHHQRRQHAWTPLSRIQSSSQISAGQPLFETLLIFENYPQNEAGDLFIEDGETGVFERTSYPLTLSISQHGANLSLQLLHQSSRFHSGLPDQLLRHYQNILKAFTNSDQTLLWQISPIDRDDIQQLADWNNTGKPHNEPQLIHQRFDLVGHRWPLQEALIFDDQILTYQQLNQRANQLAHHIGPLKPDTIIAVMLPKPKGVIANLAILKAGGAFLNLDPQTPPARRKKLLKHANAQAIITQKVIEDMRCINPDQIPADLPTQSPPTNLHPEHLAYLLYTSGSTGEPKGVFISHRALLNSASAWEENYELSPDHRHLQMARPTFDVWCGDLARALLTGGTLVLCTTQTILDPSALTNMINQNRITIAEFTPAVLRTLIAHLQQTNANLPFLKCLITGSDLLHMHELRLFQRVLGSEVQIFNTYGLTEAAVDSTAYLLEETFIPDQLPAPIGAPIHNTQVHILSPNLDQVPIGAPGQLCISGEGLARAYLDPRLTAERFTPNPFGPKGSRIYQSGDLARYLPGTIPVIEFLGRIDQQIKIRGIRVEPAEIEAAISSMPGITASAVLVHQKGTHKQLIALWSGKNQDTEAIKAHLARLLPAYLIPAAFLHVPSLPQSANLKIDRQAAQNLIPEDIFSNRDSAPPQTPNEHLLHRIWTQTLQHQQIGVHDNYFQLGGDSIIAIHLISMTRAQGYQITPKQLFENPTIHRLAPHLKPTRTNTTWTAATGSAPLLPIQKDFFKQKLPHPNYYNQSVWLRTMPLDPQRLEAALNRILQHHDILRATFTTDALTYHPAQNSQLEIIHTDGHDTQIYEKNTFAAQSSLNLYKGPVFRAQLFKTGLSEDRLFLVAHHLCIDAVSWGILLSDLAAIYQDAGKTFTRTAPFSVAAEENNKLAKPTSEAGYLHTADDTDPGTTRDATTIVVSLDQELTARLLGPVHTVLRTRIDDILLTALARSLNDQSPNRDLLIHRETHGRDLYQTDVSRTLGWFTHIQTLLLPRHRQDTVKHLAEIKELIRSKTSAHATKAHVLFNYLGQTDSVQTLGPMLGPAPEPAARDVHPSNPRSHPLEYNLRIEEKQLNLHITYNPKTLPENTVQSLAQRFTNELAQLIEDLSRSKPRFTPSDFPLVDISQQDLDHITALPGQLQDLYPLTPLQQGLLYHLESQNDPETYFEQITIPLEGKLHIPYLKEAWKRVTQIHPILRTAFVQSPNHPPLQRIATQANLSWRLVDLTHLHHTQSLVDAYLKQDRQKGFRPDQTPLMRFHLIRIRPDHHCFVWSHHHLLLDGWSTPLIFQQIIEIYSALSNHQPVPSISAKPFKHYIQWLAMQDSDKLKTFWTHYLKGFKEANALPVQTSQEIITVEKTLDQTTLLERIAAQHHLTLNTLHQAAWALTLSHFGAGKDVVFGATVSGRPNDLEGVREIAGLFINTIPVRIQTNPQITTNQWLQLLQDQHLASDQHSHASLVDIRSWSELSGDASLFRTLFVLENYPDSNGQTPTDLSFGQARTFQQAHYPLTLIIKPGPKTHLHLQGRGFPGNLLKHMLNYYNQTLQELVQHPQTALDQLRLPKARPIAGPDLNLPTQDLFQLFQARAHQHPDQIAVKDPNSSLTYKQLLRAAESLAAELQNHGVLAEKPIAIALPRSTYLSVAILAILRTGSIWVPLDPDLPPKRRDYVLEQSKAKLTLTLSGQEHRGPRLDVDLPRNDAQPTPIQIHPQQAAYIIYTSGSTGKPKGVIGTHQNTLNRLVWMWRQFPFETDETAVCKTTLSFIDSVWEILGSLLQGVPTLYLPQSHVQSLDLFVKQLAKHRVTRITLVPSLIQSLLQDIPNLRQKLPCLKQCISSGEPLTKTLARQFHEQMPGVQLVNLYGSSEIAGDVSFHITESDQTPIGRPISNTECRMLNGTTDLPAGVAGHLHIGGKSLARGYWRNPRQTAQAFIPTSNGERLYQTGDRVYMDAQTNHLHYLGRIDQQIKIMGKRLEPGEVEACLRDIPGVDHTAVVYHQRNLIAFITGQPLTERYIRQTLTQELPTHAIPSKIIHLDQLPLTHNGKLDRQKLKHLIEQESASNDGSPIAADPRLLVILEIWRVLLGDPNISLDDHFFQIGGNSLIAMRLAAQIQQQLHFDTTIQAIFQHPTPRSLFHHLQTCNRTKPLPPITTEPQTTWPLSPIQQRFWFLHQLNPTSTQHHIGGVLQLTGPLDVPKLRSAFEAIVKNHAILRTQFASKEGKPTLQITTSATSFFRHITSSEEDLDILIEHEWQQPFDLQNGPLLRVLLLQTAKNEHLLLVVLHHIIADGWSLNLIVENLVRLYSGKPIAPPKYQHHHLSRWRQTEMSHEMEEQLQWWIKHLGKPPEPIQLPTTQSDQTVGAQHSIVIDSAQTRAFNRIAHNHQATPFVFLLTVYHLLLQRLSNTTDIVIGIPVSGRTIPESEPMIGCFVNTLPLRYAADPNQTFAFMLQSISERCMLAFQHQELPFEQLVEAINPARSLDRNPLFDITFNFLNLPQTDFVLPNLSITPHQDRLTPQPKFIIELSAHQQDGQTRLTFTYQTRLFTQGFMDCMAEQFQFLLQQITTNPNQPIHTYSLTPPSHREILADQHKPIQSDALPPITQTFVQIATSFPRSTALVNSETSMTYYDLDQKSERIAQYLISHGHRPTQTIAIQGQASAGLIAAILGVLKASGVFLLLPEDLPPQRRDFMIAESNISHHLTIGEERGQIHPKTAHIDGFQPEQLSLPPIYPDQPAYIFFTSGSSGLPKAVRGNHKALAQFINWQSKAFEITPDDRIAQLSGLTFDAILRDIFLPLSKGASLHIPSPDQRQPQLLPDWLEQNQITVLHTVPSLLQSILDQAHPNSVPFLRHLITSGEPITGKTASTAGSLFPNAQITNLYGPTETTMIRTAYTIPRDPQIGPQLAGKPIPATQIHILDDSSLACGLLQSGHIHILTPHHAQYLRPAQQAESFTPAHNGLTLYKTGDLGRFLPNGHLEVLGRIDRQIKIRGVRIHPLEIEVALNKHPAIQRAHILYQDQSLTAFIQCSEIIPTDHIRQHLLKNLPPAFIPQRFRFMPKFSLLPNGKVDAKALPNQDFLDQTNEPIRLKTPIDSIIRSIWERVLQKPIPDNADFFELGGHSLTAVQLFTIIRQELDIQAPLSLIFQHGSLDAFTSALQLESGSDQPSLQPIAARTNQTLAPLSFHQKRLTYLTGITGPTSTHNMPIAIKLKGPLNYHQLRTALQTIVQRHQALRTTIRDDHQIIHPAKTLALPVIDLTFCPELAEELIGVESSTPFQLDLSLFRTRLLLTGPNTHILLITFHHIICDEWSIGLIAKELTDLYRAPQKPLPPVHRQYGDFASQQQDWLKEQTLEKYLDFWRNELEDIPEKPEYFTDFSRSDSPHWPGAVYRFTIQHEIVRQINQMASMQSVTPFMILLGAFAALLNRSGAGKDLVIGVPNACRTHPDVTRIVGFFADILTLRIKPSSTMSFHELVKLVRSVMLRAHVYEDIPFEQLVAHLQKDRHPGHSPLTPVMFGLSTEAEHFELAGLETQVMPQSTQNARHDFELHLRESGDTYVGQFLYRSDLYRAETIARKSEQFIQILQALLQNPDDPIESISLLKNTEETELLKQSQISAIDDLEMDQLEHMNEEDIAQMLDLLQDE